MLKHQLLLFTLLGWWPLFGQSDYFQQQADFIITATLDDEKHQLKGYWEMDYYNNSPDTLAFIYLHLWPNAFSEKTTAFAKQMLRNGDTEFYFADEAELGFIDSLNFTVDNESLKIETTDYGPDVIVLRLNTPLLPQQKTTIQSSFRMQFPASFSRLGHLGQSYQATQWYPKPAVYDRDGWHPMPYLDYGEFYSEFGNFDVHLTLPANYQVGATGELLSPAERARLLAKAQEDAQRSWTDAQDEVWTTPPFPPSDPTTKTLHYRAENVHDFAWFADKRFYVLHDTLQLNTVEDPIDVWSFFTEEQAQLWQESVYYMKRSTRFYSEKIGDYPYPQVTAVQSALSAGSGMEYPMITVIGWESTARSLDDVLAHEIGHNWFYGVLATNERDHAWLDEGFNSYYDFRYDQKYYGEVEPILPKIFRGKSKTTLEEQGYRYYGCQHLNQPPDTPAEKLRSYNYWIGSYSVPQRAFLQLEEYWGRGRLDRAMQQYYQTWQFRHPQPVDVQQVLEQAGEDQLDWFFQGFMASTGMQDYAIKKVTQSDSCYLTLTNEGDIAGPVMLSTTTVEGEEKKYSLAGFYKEKNIVLPPADYQKISIDKEQHSLEMHRHNNYWTAGLWKTMRAPELRFYAGAVNEERSSIFVAPFVGFNEYDGIMPGLLIHNRGVLPRKVEWLLAPVYGTRSNSIDGLAGFQTNFDLPQSERLRSLRLFSTIRRFPFRKFAPEDLYLSYWRSSSGLSLLFKQRETSKWLPSVHYRFLYIGNDDLQFSNEGDFLGTETRTQNSHELSLELEQKWVLAPMKARATLEQLSYTDDFDRDQQATKLRLEARGKMLYQKNKAFHWRLFAGFFLVNSLESTTYTPAPAFSLFDRGVEDYRYDNLYLKRQGGGNITGRQLGLRDGGFRAPVPAAFSVGRSNSRMISVNSSFDLPFTPDWFALKPYLDAASFLAPRLDGEQNQFLWVGGLTLELLDGKVALFAPLVGSSEIMDRLKENGGLGQRIGLRILLAEMAPWHWMNKLENW